MKDLLKKIDDLMKKYRALTRRQKVMFWTQAVVFTFMLLIFGGLITSIKPPNPSSPVSRVKTVSLKEAASSKNEGNSFLLGDDVDQKSYVQKIESQYYAVVEKNQGLEQKVSDLAAMVLIHAEFIGEQIQRPFHRQCAES